MGDTKPTGHQTAILLREKYTKRISAIQMANEKIKAGQKLSDSDIASLRAVGVSEAEIDTMVKSAGG